MNSQVFVDIYPEIAYNRRRKGVSKIERLALTVKEAAKTIGVSEATMRLWVQRKKIPSVKFGESHKDTRRIMVSDLIDYMEQHKEG